MVAPSKQIGVRIDEPTKLFMAAFNKKYATAIQESIDIFVWMYRATLSELQDRFTKPEIVSLLDALETVVPSWEIMSSPNILVQHINNCERSRKSVTSHGADLETLVGKLNALSSAQATVLQSEFVNFWKRPFASRTGDFGNLFDIIRPLPDGNAPIHFRDKQQI